MRIDIYHHFICPDLTGVPAQLDRLQRDITGLIAKGNELMATTQELLDTVTALAAAVEPLPAAIDALEAAVTAASGISAGDQANIDAAVASLQAIGAGVAAAVADATDGVDEAKV
jgi:uncharacterized protein YoxC